MLSASLNKTFPSFLPTCTIRKKQSGITCTCTTNENTYDYLNYRKESNILFNNALNTFYLQLYGIEHMVKDHSNSEREKLLLHGLLFGISKTSSFICTIPQSRWHIPQPLLHTSWSTGWTKK